MLPPIVLNIVAGLIVVGGVVGFVTKNLRLQNIFLAGIIGALILAGIFPCAALYAGDNLSEAFALSALFEVFRGGMVMGGIIGLFIKGEGIVGLIALIKQSSSKQ